jgi:hypothetical protein
MLAPVQVLVLGVPDPARGHDVITALRQIDTGVVQVIDAFVVSVAEDGSIDAEGTPRSAPLFSQAEAGDGTTGEAGGDAWHLGEVVPPGTHAVVVLLEHRWATPLRDALAVASGAVSHETWLDADDRDALERLLTP